MNSLGNFGGILYKKNIPLLSFKFKSGMLIDVQQIVEDDSQLPFEMKHFGLYDGTESFFSDRPTPHTRIGIDETLAKTPIQYYNAERMLRYNHAQCIDDVYWVKQDNDIKCWIGSPLEGIGVKPNDLWENLVSSCKYYK